MKIADELLRKAAGANEWRDNIKRSGLRAAGYSIDSTRIIGYFQNKSKYVFPSGKYELPDLAEQATKLFKQQMVCWVEVVPNDPVFKWVVQSVKQD